MSSQIWLYHTFHFGFPRDSQQDTCFADSTPFSVKPYHQEGENFGVLTLFRLKEMINKITYLK